MTSFGLEILGGDECEALLRNHSIGRIAVWSGPHPAILPVLYGMLDGDVIIRTAPGEKLIAAVLGQTVVFEIDGAEPARHTGWSVNVVGHAERVESAVDVERATELALEPWAGEWRNDYVRIHAEQVTGRRIMADTGALTTGP